MHESVLFPMARGVAGLAIAPGVFLLSALAASPAAVPAASGGVRIEKKAAEFARTHYLTKADEERVRRDGILRGNGEADYDFTVPASAWYELYVQATTWPTDLYLDGAFLIHTVFDSGVWPSRDGAFKVLNVFLGVGAHTLRFSRPWFPGLPFMRRFFLVPSRDATGRARLVPGGDHLCFRVGEPFRAKLFAGRGTGNARLTVRVSQQDGGAFTAAIPCVVPAGEGVFETELVLPTDSEGVFDAVVTTQDGRCASRVLQYLVVDTRQRPPAPEGPELESVERIDCTVKPPDYVSEGGTRVVSASFGPYRESGDRGHAEQGSRADWFAYVLNLPEVEAPYLLEIVYPDDDERTFTISIIEPDMPGGRALTHGIASGGMYRLSHSFQTTSMVFYPRRKDPRVHFRNWWDGQRAAVAEIRVYRMRSGFPRPARDLPAAVRRFGRYQEEPCRFVQWGARPVGNRWENLWRPAERIGRYSNWVGVNLWQPTVAIYGAALWPSRYLPSLDRDADLWAVTGPPTKKEPLPKDTLRLLLLAAEKYRMKLIGELFMPASRPVMRRYFEERFGGNGEIEWKPPAADKPWLVVHRTGRRPGTALYNPLFPGVQDWVADIVRELALRYRDSPAFDGVAIRFMGWQFHGWQGFPSIHWGYGDYTIRRFERETGTKIPVRDDDSARFQKRFEWLMEHAYPDWVRWRCRRMQAYYRRLAKILVDARPDLRLFLDFHGPNFGQDADSAEYDRKGWTGLLRETGIDPALYRDVSSIVLRPRRHYPPGIRGVDTRDPAVRFSAINRFYDPAPLQAAAQSGGEQGSLGHIHFDANSFESNLARLRDLGLAPAVGRKPGVVHGAGLLFPAGKWFRERFADAMAESNIVSMTDGSHGYISWPPKRLRAFTEAYLSVPAVPMRRVPGAVDPVAVWYGRDGVRTVAYAVNRADVSVTAGVRFHPASSGVRRLPGGESLAVDPDGTVTLKLKPFELVALAADAGAAPVSSEAKVPPEIVGELRGQAAFAADLLKGGRPTADRALAPCSLVDFQRAREKLAEVRKALAAGHVVMARHLLMHPWLVKLYGAFDAWPPDLWQRRAPRAPEGAMLPRTLLDHVLPAQRSRVRVASGAEIVPALAGVEVLALGGGPVTFERVHLPVANRYRISLGWVTAEPGAAFPAVQVDGRPLADARAAPVWRNRTWTVKTFLAPVVLEQGEHRITLEVEGGAGATVPVGIFFLHVAPVWRPLPPSNWLVFGPYPGVDTRKGPGPGFADHLPLPKQADFAQVPAGTEGARGVRRRPSVDAVSEYVDLYRLTGAYSRSISCAVTRVRSPQPRDALLRFGVDYWGVVLLNGRKVLEVSESHGPPRPAQFTAPLRLGQGDNEIRVIVHAGSAGNGFWAALSDPGDLEVDPRAR
ncbi:MAG: family 10 glycosylhydrolase [Kiritimatiellaeota bacterium]|nr:family 10 glycosylhydrolase [Kiritimatiellota bacterium]